ncbi:MAG: hypothetical protein JEZ07_19795 [Phycisphaerae bacterium]|nr:hypothetical protein [Phycisphaerae bacterium]
MAYIAECDFCGGKGRLWQPIYVDGLFVREDNILCPGCNEKKTVRIIAMTDKQAADCQRHMNNFERVKNAKFEKLADKTGDADTGRVVHVRRL